jgi:hypothetical protein
MSRSALRGVGVLLALGVALLAGAQQASAAPARASRAGDYPGISALALASPVRDGIARSSAASLLKAASTWGGTYTTSSGSQIAMYASSWWRVDSQWLQGWANWMDKVFPHGTEFSRLTVLFVPEQELGSACGPGAAGCYLPDRQLLIAPGNNLSGVRMESVLAHEYGHHIANNRSNPPWDANAWGPKRWASSMNVCRRVAAGTAFPGDEGNHYKLNPGEAWAETYRQTVETRTLAAGSWPVPPWGVVDQSFYPDQSAFTAVFSDVRYPLESYTETFTGRLTKRQRTFTVQVGTPTDGDMSVELFRPFNARMTLIDGDSGAIVRTATASFSQTVCGTRLFKIRISGPVGKSYRIVVNRPGR